jgi:hypothetical protein
MNAPRIVTSYWANRELSRLPVVPVGISRGVPKWPLPFRYRRAMLLAPSRETFALPSDRAFEAAYLAELEATGVQRITDLLRKISDEEGGKTLVLLCWEKPGEVCHRGQFAEFWESSTGIIVPELQNSVQSHNRSNLQDAQERLF